VSPSRTELLASSEVDTNMGLGRIRRRSGRTK
jgi:hypothetical protein